MGTTHLQQFLQSLCHNCSWSYAVFWKLRHENEKLLTWEVGCYDCLKLGGSEESLQNDSIFNGSKEIFSCSWGSCRHDGHSGEYPACQAVADLARVQYPWGEGVVGEVASTGNHRWFFCKNTSAGEFACIEVPECPSEWLLQFAAGIKTILLVPIVPHGVLQLGSLEKVAECLAVVTYIRDKFNAYQNGMDSFPSITVESLDEKSLLMPFSTDNLDKFSAAILNQMKSDDLEAVYIAKPTNRKLSTTNIVMPACHISDKGVVDAINNKRENEMCVQSIGLTRVSEPLDQLLNDTESEMIDGIVVGFSSLYEELQALSYSDNYNVVGEHANPIIKSDTDIGMIEQPFVDKDADNWGNENVNTFLSFPMDSELHKALGPDFMDHTKESVWDPSISVDDINSVPGQIFNSDLIHGIEPLDMEACEWSGEIHEAEHLLQAVLSCMPDSLIDNSSNRFEDVKISPLSSGPFVASNKAHNQSEEGAFVMEKRIQRNFALGEPSQKSITGFPSSPCESTVSTLVEQQQQQKKVVNCHLQSKRGPKLSNARTRRLRPGENQRPRPRDRQLIQDRLKELRQLVPNGSKCSIDGLLDKTIKHMLFLRDVTDQADKLRQCVREEAGSRDNVKLSGTKCDTQSGTTWAVELGGDLQVSPIVVEDLEYPGQMLIEMLCKDHGLFLEIAKVIRCLELTILTGVMESWSNNRWARFVVEAPRGFRRLDIFWPLMQLLQHDQWPSPGKI
ncbi:transcription factor LHW-like [Diospyros lotus]|uniref:transcription factor LHW-like n=1 Tax=Diospyros lotus TaxID=55363 RepID=UPI0022532ABF|nr:transcription factor LHW-like [Diospyros lotus]XP_052175031.1 transcription factor LHW-like [Diospyros lotus]XP_052175032.1 transcription factor LHW-like [Diospyros lotus]XP_052175033.1 transcription factor LHW-like [Diospyros lotus]XP_052175034.1 transcription factor LHW-like [Diospyros lotus]